MESKNSIESNTTKNMFSVVEQMNAGYGKYFDSKPKTSTVRSECYSNYKTCGTISKDIPKQCVGANDDGSNSENNSLPAANNNRNVVQEVLVKTYLCSETVLKNYIFSSFHK